MGVNGQVKNGVNGVEILFNANKGPAKSFYLKVLENAPPKAKIISHNLFLADSKTFNDFSIVLEETNNKNLQVLLSPDNAICATCEAELTDTSSRRYRYPFITCTQCGPRYSIVKQLPFEREYTAMKNFSLCAKCKQEYNNPNDRRFFSQTNSCAACGIELSISKKDGSAMADTQEEILKFTKELFQQGSIIAVKGVGGYLLLCDAGNATTINLLRNRKHRPRKPFAILYPDLQEIEANFHLNKKEKETLCSDEAPIVLLQPKEKGLKDLAINSIAPGLNRLGIMRPYSPLLNLLANDFARPLIATSANISGSPIIYKDHDAFEYLFDIADYIVSYNREITVPQDDSVVAISAHTNNEVILRRSRGYAPSFFCYTPKQKKCVLSMGAHLKSSFTLSINGNVFVSQFLGSGESYESQSMYKNTLAYWLKLYNAHPKMILADMHPGYFSHEYAIELSGGYDCEIKFVQHHKAHFAAVLAENNLVNNDQPVLGVIWDGTGLGDDGNIWGGEFFIYQNNTIQRRFHFDYFPAIAGDKMALEPRISALCVANDLEHSRGILKQKFSETEWNNYHSLVKTTTLFSSSVGRLFDTVASLVGLGDKQTYEGETAMYLQALAEIYIEKNGLTMDHSYFDQDVEDTIPVNSLIKKVIIDINTGEPVEYIAAKFHYSLADLIGKIATYLNVKQIAFSGGVFQNTLLIDWIQILHSNNFALFFHKNLSPNDENISFGQMVFYDNNMATKTEFLNAKEAQHIVSSEKAFAAG